MSDKEIDDKLEEIMEGHQDHFMRLIAKLIYNLRYDLDELKLELLKVLKEDDCEVNHKKEEEDGRFYT